MVGAFEMGGKIVRGLAAFVMLCFAARGAFADTTMGGGFGSAPERSEVGDIQSQYNSLDLDVLGDDLVGDHIDLDTGALTLTQTDVSIPGNSELPVSFGRSISRSGLRGTWTGNWTPAVPYISRRYLDYFGANPDRCSGKLVPS